MNTTRQERNRKPRHAILQSFDEFAWGNGRCGY